MKDPWFPRGATTTPGKFLLFCFHHAGGGASSFVQLRRHLGSDVDLIAAQLPGREERLDDLPFRRMEDIVAPLSRAMRPYLTRPFAMFGHSMGAAIAFELARQVTPRPSHLFLSSWRPRTTTAGPRVSSLPDADFLARLAAYGGTPESVLRMPDMLRALMRVMRADMAVLENYQPTPPVTPPCPTTVLGGSADKIVTPEGLRYWSNFRPAVDVHLLPGGHFYLREGWPAVSAIIKRTLSTA